MSASIDNSKLSNYVIVLLGVRASLDHEDGLKGVLEGLMDHSAIIVEPRAPTSPVYWEV